MPLSPTQGEGLAIYQFSLPKIMKLNIYCFLLLPKPETKNHCIFNFCFMMSVIFLVILYSLFTFTQTYPVLTFTLSVRCRDKLMEDRDGVGSWRQ